MLRWAEATRPRWVVVENVPEFQTWGPLGADHRPLQSRKGETFQAWAHALRALGYTVDWRVLNAADYGAATSRRRKCSILVSHGMRRRIPSSTPSSRYASAMRVPPRAKPTLVSAQGAVVPRSTAYR